MEDLPGSPAEMLPLDPARSGPACKDRYMSLDAMSAALTRFELGLMRVYQAFSSWALELQKYVSGEQFSFQEVALLHCVRLRGGTTTIAEMMLFLHRQDLAAINYSLRKLEKHGLIRRARGPQRREVAYGLTDHGRSVTDAYGAMRHQVLVELCRQIVDMQRNATEAAAVIERLIGVYDQSAQAVLNQSLIAASTSSAGESARPNTHEVDPARRRTDGTSPRRSAPARGERRVNGRSRR